MTFLHHQGLYDSKPKENKVMIQQSSQKTVAVVEARMTSSRLPGKHMLPVNGKPILSHLIKRLKAVSNIDEIIIAITLNSSDDVLEELALEEEVRVFRGSEIDVMSRVLGAALAHQADVICEVTGDCPIIDVALLEYLIDTYFCNHALYINNGRFGLPDGMGAQVFSVDALKRSEKMTDDPLDREHVTLHMRRNPGIFPSIYLPASKHLYWPNLGLTLDEKEDYELLKKIIEHFGSENSLFSCLEVIDLLKEKSDWTAINRSVLRKGDT
jgi:spore coat polysaccharide biosynthesis protein SpsF